MNLSLRHALLELILPFALIFALTKLVRIVIKRTNSPLALLKGPPGTSKFLPGGLFDYLSSDDIGALCELWARQYGAVFKIPTWLGGSHVILCDPKAVAHVYAKDGFAYLRSPPTKTLVKAFFGESMIATDGEDHRRLRRIMAPAFSIPALRELTGIFYDSAYKVKGHWEALLESSDEVVVDIENWMNRTTLDTIGIAGFGHDFRAIHGHQSHVYGAFTSMQEGGNAPSKLLILLCYLLPPAMRLPLRITAPSRRLMTATSEIAMQLLDNFRRAASDSDMVKDRSILGTLRQTEDANSKLLHDEVKGQISLLLFAGYDTMAISLSWAFVELARHPEVQEKLREEVHQFAGSDPTWDQLMHGLPYLNAVVQETLRLHPAVQMTTRVVGPQYFIY
jgi:cytochrome P450